MTNVDTDWLIVFVSPFIGSFLALIVDRVPRKMTVIFGRSVCQACGQQLRLIDLIPVASWLLLRGHCRYCGASIPLWILAMELGALFIALVSTGLFNGWLVLLACLFGWLILTLAAFDFRSLRLPDLFTGMTFVVGLVQVGLISPAIVLSHSLAALAAGLFLWATAKAYRAIRRQAGLGLGDVKLFAVLGIWLGPLGLAPALFLASVSCILWVLVYRGRQADFAIEDRLPFGAFLAVSGWIVWLYMRTDGMLSSPQY